MRSSPRFATAFPVAEGFGRSDAAGRIGNLVLGERLQQPANFRSVAAPVSFPALWDIWRFDWVQRNGSIRQPMMRNIATVIGLESRFEVLDDRGKLLPEPQRYRSSVSVRGLHCAETLLEQLRPPRWPEAIFGPVDRAKAARGKPLYEQHCARRHDAQPISGSREWRIPMIPVAEVGTDPNDAVNYAGWMVDISKLDPGDARLRQVNVGDALAYLARQVRAHKYAQAGLSPAEQAAFDGFGRRDHMQAVVAYRARPLDGVWATPPFLHNGSVPSLDALLLPAARCPKELSLGRREFDPMHVGLVTEHRRGMFRFDTRMTGNANTGHEYGTDLPNADRWALIEYLKVIGEDRPPEPPPSRWHATKGNQARWIEAPAFTGGPTSR